jgi:hypothetical protein
MFVFLTREGDDPSDEDWTTYSYGRIKEVLERIRRTNEGAIGEDVDTFLDHYLHLVGSRLMNDEINDLCRKIYKQYRQALDQIIRVVESEQPRRLSGAEELLGSRQGSIRVLAGYRKAYTFVPHAVHDALPPIGIYSHHGAKCWLVWKVDVWKNKARLLAEVWDCTDRQLRREVVLALTDPNNDLGFTVSSRAKGDINALLDKGSTLRLGAKNLHTLTDDPDEDAAAIKKSLDKHLLKLDGLSHRIASVIKSVAGTDHGHSASLQTDVD